MTIRSAIFFLISSVLMTLSLFFGGSLLWHRWHSHRIFNPESKITALIQTGPEKEALPTSYLSELLDLSIDRTDFLYAFDLKKGTNNLLSCPLISQAHLKRIPPGTLYIDYTVRKPVALISDYQNIGIDREGYLLPITPFLSPKNLPEIYLGLAPFGEENGGCWQTPLRTKHLQLAFELLQALSDASWRKGIRLKRIDVSHAFAASLGQREIVLSTEEELVRQGTVYVFPKILRLSPKNYTQQLCNFFSLRQKILEDYERQIPANSSQQLVSFSPRIIDLRIPKMAFVQNG